MPLYKFFFKMPLKICIREKTFDELSNLIYKSFTSVMNKKFESSKKHA